ncbi:MAG: hypothetical protein GY838_17050, partial [bacterium]|nr:hypothetical protein [bacterium]
MARAVRQAFCANIAVLPDPAHRGMHAVEDGLLPSVPCQGLYVLVAELRSWLASDKRRRMMARLLEEFPEAGVLLPGPTTTHNAPRLLAMPKAHNIRWAAARLRELRVLWRSWPIFCLVTLDMALGSDRAACKWTDKELADAQAVHNVLADVRVWRLCGFLVDYLTLMDVLSHAFQQRGLDTVLTHEAVRQCIRRLRCLGQAVQGKVAGRPGREQALVSRAHRGEYMGIAVRGREDDPLLLKEREEIVGRTIAGLGLRFGAEPDGSRAPFRDPTLPAGFHQLADERRWAESTPDSRGQLAEHLLPFTGVTAQELEGQWADALELRARNRGLAHRAFWTT